MARMQGYILYEQRNKDLRDKSLTSKCRRTNENIVKHVYKRLSLLFNTLCK